MKWKIELDGNKKGLEELCESFDENPQVFEEKGEYFLYSPKFQQLNNAGDVRDAGKNIIKIIRHIGEIDSIRVDELEWSCIVEIQEDGSERRIVPLSANATVSMRAEARLSVGDEDPTPKAESTYKYTQLALKDDVVQDLIELRDNGDRWANLYRIYEYIQANIQSENNIVEQGWWSESEKVVFKQTANSREAIAYEARHGDDRVPAPSDPIDHAEAKSLIDRLINRWLNHRKKFLERCENEN